jgi:hypothetical protein
MRELDKSDTEAAQADSAKGDVGDVEAAGETTAAATISGPADTKPVGADTMAKVGGTRDHVDNDE